MGAVEGIGCVVAVGPAVIKQDHPGKTALAVWRQIAAARCGAVSIAHKKLVHVVGVVEGINDAGALARGAWLAWRLEFFDRRPRADLLKLRPKAVPLGPEEEKRRRDLGQAIKDARPGPGVWIARVRVDRRRKHVLNGASAQFKHDLGFARIALHRPTDLVGFQPLWRAEKHLAAVRTADDLWRGCNDCIVINAEGIKDQTGVGHIVHIKGAGARRPVQQAHVVRWVGGEICLGLFGVRDGALWLLPAKGCWPLCSGRHGHQEPSKIRRVAPRK